MKNAQWVFRTARPDEAQTILSLYRSARNGTFCTWNDSYPGIQEIEADLETNNLYVLTCENKIVGAISVVPENELDMFDCWTCKEGKEIARVVIDEAYQGNGLSYEMLQRLIPILREKGCVSIHLSVVKTNLPAYKTYIKAGFTTVGEAQMYGNSYYLMEKAIDVNFLDKQRSFFENTKILSDTLEITPLMYGSLGLEYLTGHSCNADDIDILVPKIFVTERWTELKNLLEENGYILIDEHEHTFEKDGIHYSYAQIEELESFAGIPLSEIEIVENGNIRFQLLSLLQYLKVYTASVKDGYRINTRKKKDFEKITLIQELLSFQPKESKEKAIM